mgnify:CR=1 FL=1
MNSKPKSVRSWGRLVMKYKLSEIMDLIGGGTPKTTKPEYWDGDIPWLSVKDFNNDFRFVYETEKHITELGLNNSSTKLLQAGDIIISARGTVGEIATIPFPMAFNQSCYGLRAKKEIVTADFLYYLIKHNIHVLKKNTHGSVFDTITRDTFAGIEVDIPDMDSQSKIAEILSNIDEKIEVNVRINENLYDQMLTIFNNARDTASWNRRKLSDVLTFFDNLRKPLSSIQREKMEHIYPYYGATSIVDYVEDYLFEGTYILVSEDGANVVDPAGHPLTQYTHGKFWVNNHAHIVKGTNGYSEALVYALLGTLNMQSIVTGAAQPKINQANLRNFEAVLPESNEAQKLSNILNPMLQQMILNDQENERLSALRDTLLPQLMSGLFDISGIEL